MKKQLTEIANRNWDYTLYKAESFIFTVIFFGKIDFPRSFTISEEESKGNLEELSKKIRENYEDFKEREIKPAILE